MTDTRPCPLELQLLAMFRAYMRQCGGPDPRSMVRVLDGLSDEVGKAVAGWSDSWQKDTSRTLEGCATDLAMEIEALVPEVIQGTHAQLGSLSIRGDAL